MNTIFEFAPDQAGDRHPLFPIFLLETEFPIDWAVELLAIKVSDTLAIIEKEIHDGLLRQVKPGIYAFDAPRREKILAKCPAQDREAGHRRIVDILLREMPNEKQKALALAPHLLQISGSPEHSIYLMQAGNILLKKFQYKEAFQCFKKILDDLADLHGANFDSMYLEAAVKHSKISIGQENTETVLDILHEAMARAKTLGKRSCQSLLEMHIAKNKWLLSDYNSALAHFSRGWDIAKQLEDSSLLRSAKTFSSFFLYWQGKFREVVQSYEKSVSDVEQYPHGSYPLIATALAAYCYCLIGQVTQGIGMLNSIHDCCLERKNFFAAARASLNIGKAMFEIGETDRALQYIEIASKEASQGQNSFVLISSKLLMAYCFYMKGDNDRAIDHLEKFLFLRNQVKVLVQPYPYLLEMLWAMKEGKFPAVSGLAFEQVLQQMIQDANIFMKGVAYRFRALLQKMEGASHAQVLRSLQTSIKWLEESGHKTQLARSLIELTRLNLSLDNLKAAEKCAQKASHILSGFNQNIFPDDLRSLVSEKQDDKELLKEILRLGQEVVTIRNDNELVQHIISTVNRITGAERGAIFVLAKSDNESELKLRASKGLTMRHISDSNFKAPMELIREVAKSGKGRITEIDMQSECNYRPNETIRSQICVPMILKNQVIGVLYHDNCFLCSAFSEFDLELLSYFATFCGFALEKARAWEEVQRLNKKLDEENKYYEEEKLESMHFEDIVGESGAIKDVLRQIRQVANTGSNVLILGETGVGKELVARAIHRLSDREDHPFIRLNCSSYPESLIPSELFGHEKGAFTGASSRRVGRFELADTGTLFLDEVGELSMDIQIRLLQVLQIKEFERVGGSETIRSDFRLIAATNQNLRQMMNTGGFRSDLFYRLNVFPIYVPPLRERKEDIPLLAHYFLKIYSAKMRKPLKWIPDKEMDRLIEYHWPGNVRELENIIERGVILSVGPRFKAPALRQNTESLEDTASDLTLRDNEKNHIMWAVNKTQWKIRGPGGAAELLALHPSTLAYRMKKLSICRPKGTKKRRAPS